MALTAGSIAFTGFNADGNDNLAFVALETIAAGTTIHFSDRAWDGSTFSTLETFWSWTATTTVAAGTVVTMDNFASGTLSTNVGSIAFTATNNRGLSATAEVVYAYIGSDPTVPTTFLAAISSRDFSVAADGLLTNTGLVAGVTALALGVNGGVDIGAYTGANTGMTSFSAYLALINNPANWAKQDATGDQSADGTAPDLPFSTIDFAVCFAAGTHIATPNGEVRVEDIRAGDLLTTVSDSIRPVVWVGRRRIALASHPHPECVAPVRIRAGAFGRNLPHRDLVVSPDHAILVDGALIIARRLINGVTILQERDAPAVTYFHIELDRHAILLSEGLTTESYLDTGNRGFFANSDRPTPLHADPAVPAQQACREANSCAPFLTDDAAVHAVWQRLARHARRDDGATTTNDPAPFIVHDGGTLLPLHVDASAMTFAIPARTTGARLLTLSARPTDTRPWLEDNRRLGVRIARMTLAHGAVIQDLALDRPALSDGWWPIERDGHATRRWTNGAAALALPHLEHPVILTITLAGGIDYRVDAVRDRRIA